MNELVEISSENMNNGGWYEGRLQMKDGKPVLSQGQKYARLFSMPPKVVKKHEGEIIFVKGVLGHHDGKYVIQVSDLGAFYGRHRDKYVGKKDDVIIHSERYNSEETGDVSLLEQAKELRDVDENKLW